MLFRSKKPTTTAGKKEPAKTEQKPAVKQAEPAKAKPETEKEERTAAPYSGKWMILAKEDGRYIFELFASNGEKMLASGSDYSTLSGAKNGIETFKRNIGNGRFDIVRAKSGDYFFKLFSANGSLMAISSDYKTRTTCENAMESTTRFAATAEVILPKKQ